MNKPLPFLFATTLFVSGLLIGLIANNGTSAQERGAGPSTDARLLTSTLAAETSINVACLRRLRAGETNVAISVLESRVEGDLVTLAERLSALPSPERDPQHLQVIRMFRDYREKFPHTNSVPQILDGVAGAYGLLADEQKGGH